MVIQGMVKIEDGVTAPAPKKTITSRAAQQAKFKNDDLPLGCKPKWRSVFVPTYMKFIATYNNPWAVDDDDAVNALQAIWNAIYGSKIPEEIDTKSAVFEIVRTLLIFELILINIQAGQRVNEWRGGFGSTALVMINNFFEFGKELFNTDEKCVEFSRQSIKTLSFLYENTDNPKVSVSVSRTVIYVHYTLYRSSAAYFARRLSSRPLLHTSTSSKVVLTCHLMSGTLYQL
jgi:hypothetical protein